nr:BCCT family transporter [Aliamphritea spongicola]
MLFSAGIGIGILFFGVAEPIFYLDNSGGFGYPNNPYADMAGATALGYDRAVDALRVTFFHWGFHGWAVYVIVGMSLAYFAYRKNCHWRCVLPCIRSSVSVSTGRLAMRWISSVYWAVCSVWPPRWVWVSARCR